MQNNFTQSVARLAAHAALLLHWRPDEFWAATPAELAGIFAAMVPDIAAPPDTAQLAQLMEAYPDAQSL